MPGRKIVIAGGGAAGFFAAIACAQADRANEVTLLERSSQFLTKVRISGGGRCNVTHACFDPREFTSRYPRGARELISPLHRFSATDTMTWFERRGVRLKTERDGRMFPVTDSSATIIQCLLREAEAAGVKMRTRCGVERIDRTEIGQFVVTVGGGAILLCDRLLLATGGSRNEQGALLAKSLGHSTEPAVPSLFTFQSNAGWLRSLAGVSVANVEASIPSTKLRERGPLLITHEGVSGPVILRLSAWGARILHQCDYRFVLRVNWLPAMVEPLIAAQFRSMRETHPNRLVINSPIPPLPARLWKHLASEAHVTKETRWTTLSRQQSSALADALLRTEIAISGKSLNQDEFVTCGGVRRREVNFKTMESRITPHLYFAGELLNVDGITGGFNFQSAWATGWIAGHAMAGVEPEPLT